MDILGVDIGGSFIKCGVVDTSTGLLASELFKVETPLPATPAAIAERLAGLVAQIGWKGPIGCGFPAIIKGGCALSAANIDSGWVGADVGQLLSSSGDCPIYVVNDADAAGLAEVCFGAGVNEEGTVLVVTLGTGIGSALFFQGELFPNLELGHLPLNGAAAEHYASAAIKVRDNLNWQEWSQRLNEFFMQVERVISPDLIIVGGGVSQDSVSFFHLIETRARIVPAHQLNQAGLIGAASFAARHHSFDL